MQVYVLIESNIYQDGSEDSRTIGIFDTEEKANELCEKMLRSIMYDSRQNKRFYVRVKQLNESKMTGEIPKEGWVVLKLRYRYTGGNTTDPIVVNDPMHYILKYEWFLDKTPPIANFSSDCVISYLPVIENESREDFEQRRVAKFHEMWEMLNNYRRENDLVTLPFSIIC